MLLNNKSKVRMNEEEFRKLVEEVSVIAEKNGDSYSVMEFRNFLHKPYFYESERESDIRYMKWYKNRLKWKR